MLNFVDKIKLLDFLAPPLSLKVDGRVGVRTVCGAVLTVTFVVTFLMSSLVLVLGYFNTRHPIVMKDTATSQVYPKMTVECRYFWRPWEEDRG